MQTVTLQDLRARMGVAPMLSGWVRMDQARINGFADVTEDHQFIHVDPDRAARETSFGGPIAHGFLTLSMLSKLAGDVALVLEGLTISINYGFEKIRFLQPVRAGARIRGKFAVTEVSERASHQYLIRYSVEIEIEGEEKPALIADWLTLQVLEG